MVGLQPAGLGTATGPVPACAAAGLWRSRNAVGRSPGLPAGQPGSGRTAQWSPAPHGGGGKDSRLVKFCISAESLLSSQILARTAKTSGLNSEPGKFWDDDHLP